MKVGLLVLLLSSCAKDVPMPPQHDTVYRRYMACTAGLGDAFFDVFPKLYRHEAHRIAAECLEFYEFYAKERGNENVD